MKKTTQTIYRQGDVLIERIASIPNTAVKAKPENGRIILAHGEATGHHHSIDMRDADWWKDTIAPTTATQTTNVAPAVDQFLTVKKATAVVHQEHGPIALPPGKYRVRRQREYSPEAIRNVAD